MTILRPRRASSSASFFLCFLLLCMVTRAAAATVQLPSVPRRHLRGDKPPNESILEEMDSPTSLQDEPSISSISASSSAMAFKDDTTAAAEAVAPDAVAPDADKRPRIEVGRMSDEVGRQASDIERAIDNGLAIAP